MAVLIAAAMSKILAIVGEAANRRTETYNAERQEVYGKKLQAIEAALEELAKVQDTSIWDKIECACKAVVGALLIIIGVVAEVIPGLGQIGGTLTIVAGAVMLASATEEAVKMWKGHGVAGCLVRELGGSEDAANDADWISDKVLLAAEIVVAYLSFGASNAPSMLVRVITLVAALTDATGKAVVAVINKENDDHREQASRHKASEAELQAVADQISAYVQQAIEHLMQSSKARVDTLQPVFATLQGWGNAAIRVRFTTTT